MELGLPDLTGIDWLGAIIGFFQWLASVLWGAWTWFVASLGGNIIGAVLIVGLLMYVVADLFYHKFLDYPAARAGTMITGGAVKVVIFLMIFAVMFVLMYVGI